MIEAREVGELEVTALKPQPLEPLDPQARRTPLRVQTHRVTIYATSEPPLTDEQLTRLAYDLNIYPR